MFFRNTKYEKMLSDDSPVNIRIKDLKFYKNINKQNLYLTDLTTLKTKYYNTLTYTYLLTTNFFSLAVQLLY